MKLVKPPKPPITHKDIFGRLIEEGSFVAYPQKNGLNLGEVIKCYAKQLRVTDLRNRHWKDTALKYPDECVLVEGKDVTFWMIKNSK